jgi:plastocyanin
MRLRSLLLATLAAGIVLVAVLELGSSRPARTPAARRTSVGLGAKHITVKVHMYAFTPSQVTVRVGTKITFTNLDQTQHTATALNGAFDTGTIQPGKSATITLRRTGTFAYHCLFHEFMTGTIKVRR